jgi:hypothetical protein
LKVGEFEKIGFSEEEGVEPIYSALMAVSRLAVSQMYVIDGSIHTLSVNSLESIFVSTPCLGYADTRYSDSEYLAQDLELKALELSHYSTANSSNCSLPNVKWVVVQPAHFDTEQLSSCPDLFSSSQ